MFSQILKVSSSCLEDSQTKSLKGLKVINIFEYQHNLGSKEFDRTQNGPIFLIKPNKVDDSPSILELEGRLGLADQMGRTTAQ